MEDAMKQDDYAGRFPRGKRGTEPLAVSASFLLHAKGPLPLDKRGFVSLY